MKAALKAGNKEKMNSVLEMLDLDNVIKEDDSRGVFGGRTIDRSRKIVVFQDDGDEDAKEDETVPDQDEISAVKKDFEAFIEHLKQNVPDPIV